MSFPRPIYAGLLTLVLLAGCGKKDAVAVRTSDQVQPVEVTAITRQDLAETLNLVGSVAANESATIRPEISGLVRAIHFEEGQAVKKGQLLVKIDDAELRAQFAQSEARFQLAELNLKRAERLGESQSNSVADVDRARSEYASAKSELELIRVRLERSEIRAPFDGVLGARTLSPGDYVTSQSVITTIDDLSRLKIDFQVPERFLGKVKQGATFVVRSPALAAGSQLHGQVYFVASVVDRATRSSEVKGFVNAASGGLKPGMFANVELVLDVRKQVLTVPEGAILTTTAGTQVVAVKEEGDSKTAEFIPVQLGLRAKGLVEVVPVKGELDETRKIVASGVGALILFPGAKIETREFVKELARAN